MFYKITLEKNQTFQFFGLLSLEMAIELVEQILEFVVKYRPKINPKLGSQSLIRNCLT